MHKDSYVHWNKLADREDSAVKLPTIITVFQVAWFPYGKINPEIQLTNHRYRVHSRKPLVQW